jgi:hypothetical protein
LDDAGAIAFGDAAFAPFAFFAAGADRAGVPLLAGRFALPDDLRDFFADFDLDLLVVILTLLRVNDSIMCCH